MADQPQERAGDRLDADGLTEIAAAAWRAGGREFAGLHGATAVGPVRLVAS